MIGRTVRIVRPRPALAQQFSVFAVIGIIGTGVYLGLYNLLRTTAHPQIANVIAVLASMVVSFGANRRFTFGITGRRRALQQFAAFAMVFFVTLAASSAMLTALYLWRARPGRMAENATLIVANGASFVVRFLLLRRWVFAGGDWAGSLWQASRHKLPRQPSVENRRAALLLTGVGCLYGVAQLVLFDPSRFLEFDEAIYLSQVQQDVLAVPFAEHRARGVTLLVAPLALVGAPLTAIRLYLVVASAVLLVGSFWPWLRLVGGAAPLAATLFASTWLTLYYGSEIMPNLHAAFGVVAAAGLAMTAARTAPSRGTLVLLAAVICWTALVRPTDATLATAGILAVTAWPIRRHLPVTGALIAGLLAGWMPWAIEAVARFGGPIQRWRTAAELVGQRQGLMLLEHLRVTDGPLVGMTSDQPVPWAGAVWWVATLGFAIVGLLATRYTGRRSLLVSAAAALPLILAYAATASLAPRFFLPVYALVSLPAACGVVSMVQRLHLRPLRIGVIAIVCGAMLAWHVPTASRIAGQRGPARTVAHDVGDALKARVAGRRCRFAAQYSRPQIQYVSGCLGTDYHPSSTQAPFGVGPTRDHGGDGYVLVTKPVDPASPVASWPAQSLPHGWVIYDTPHGRETPPANYRQQGGFAGLGSPQLPG